MKKTEENIYGKWLAEAASHFSSRPESILALLEKYPGTYNKHCEITDETPPCLLYAVYYLGLLTGYCINANDDTNALEFLDKIINLCERPAE
jgi:hypothetical protein